MSPWIRLKRDRLALACMGFLGVVLVLGLLAPILPLSDPTLVDVRVINGMKSSGEKRDNLGSIGKDFRWECNSIAESATKKEGNQPSFFVV